jgi:hypothetical protein
MILLVTATDAEGLTLPLKDGSTIPLWGGVGDPAMGYYAGLPGKAFAKILGELWTGISPTAAYWIPTRVISDNRIPAFGTDRSQYTFALRVNRGATLKVDLWFRRAFKELMDQKGWNFPDILMTSQILRVGPQ